MTNKIWISCFLLLNITICNASWGTSSSGQYHIQTDEGPERYFRYQTDNGQYRKEKRLQDGTVIGTDAWIDAAGFLRSKDYIADGQGYRILKSKTVYVGLNRPIEEAIRSIKNLPAQNGILAHRNSVAVTTNKTPTVYLKPVTSPTATSLPTTTAAPFFGYTYESEPEVFVRHHSEPFEDHNKQSTINSISNYYPSSTARPFSIPTGTFQLPLQDDRDRSEQLKPIAVISLTPAPITTNGGYYYTSPTRDSPVSSTPNPLFATTSLPQITTQLTPISLSSHYLDYSSTKPYFGLNDQSPTTIRPNSPTTDRSYNEFSTIKPIVPFEENYLRVQPLLSRQPISVSRQPYRNFVPSSIQNNILGNDYDQQFTKYDGISVNQNGFSYYLPRQYHEEDNTDHERRQGSFGYIDPFGIRRVIYYNTSPEKGFEHRKNNRYVGFSATPYDPRP